MDSDFLKAAVTAYWRYPRHCPLVALEVQDYNFREASAIPDIIVVTSDGYVIETEVKISMSDFRNDRKKQKHKFWRQSGSGYRPIHKFYFAVPFKLANQVALKCEQLFPYAGVLGVEEPKFNHTWIHDAVKEYRRPRILGDRKLQVMEIANMVRCQSATICKLSEKIAKLTNGKTNND